MSKHSEDDNRTGIAKATRDRIQREQREANQRAKNAGAAEKRSR